MMVPDHRELQVKHIKPPFVLANAKLFDTD